MLSLFINIYIYLWYIYLFYHQSIYKLLEVAKVIFWNTDLKKNYISYTYNMI